MHNKAQIGSTLTWFVGFLIVFFVIGLLLAATTLFSLKKKIISGSDEIELEKHLSDAKQQRVLFSVLNSNINFSDKEIKIKDVLRESNMGTIESLKKQELKEKIENKVKEILVAEFGEGSCYYFQAKYSINGDLNFVSGSKSKLALNSVAIILVRDSNTNELGIRRDYEKILINFYGGKCL